MPDLTTWFTKVKARLACSHDNSASFDSEQFCKKCERAAADILGEVVGDLARAVQVMEAAQTLAQAVSNVKFGYARDVGNTVSGWQAVEDALAHWRRLTERNDG